MSSSSSTRSAAGGEVLAGRVDVVEHDPLPSGDLDVETAVVVPLDLGELDQRAHPVQRLHAAVADLVALADRDHGEGALGRVGHRKQIAHQRPVAVLEDVQRRDDAREQHRVEREDGHGRHGVKLAPAPARALKSGPGGGPGLRRLVP